MREGFPIIWVNEKLTKVIQYFKTGVLEYKGDKDYYSTGSIQGIEATSEGKYTYKTKPSRANRISQKNDVFQARMKETDKGIIIDEKLENTLFSTGFMQLRPYGNTYNPKLIYDSHAKTPTFL